MMTKRDIINVLIADDSRTSVLFLKTLFQQTDNINVIGVAYDGEQAVHLTRELKPDIITMDIMMPKLNGIDAIKQIVSECPTPIIVISSLISSQEVSLSFDALQAGALSVLEKPDGFQSERFEKQRTELLKSVTILAKVPVIKRRKQKTCPLPDTTSIISKPIQLVALGVSTGGPAALARILKGLPENFSTPVVIVIHMNPGFIKGLVAWLQNFTKCNVKIAEDGEEVRANHIYFAPDNWHLMVISKNHRPYVNLTKAGDYLCRPAIASLFQSVADNFPSKALAGLLTGMGHDGVEEFGKIKNSGSDVFLQSEESAVTKGLIRSAIEKGICEKEIALDNIPVFLSKICR